MTRLTRVQLLLVAVAAAMFAGCSGGGSSALTPLPASPASSRHLVSYYSCPATGSLKYISDAFHNLVNVYVGKFAGQSPCGQIASNSLHTPGSLYVQPATHDLYVVNIKGNNSVVVFHRGQTTPYNTYIDPTVQIPYDVKVAEDGTVIVSNFTNVANTEGGSVSTWIGGLNGGNFVGNFPMTNAEQGAYLAVKKNGTVYFDDVDRAMLQGFVWTVSCPAGACGVQTRVAGVAIKFPGGMAFDNTGDLLLNDTMAVTADTFELPKPTPSTFPLVGMPYSMAIRSRDRHWFIVDAYHNDALEYSYPGGALIGTASGVTGGFFAGIAVDP